MTEYTFSFSFQIDSTIYFSFHLNYKSHFTIKSSFKKKTKKAIRFGWSIKNDNKRFLILMNNGELFWFSKEVKITKVKNLKKKSFIILDEKLREHSIVFNR